MVKEGTHIYKVGELTQSIKAVLESAFSNIWVEGEISNFTSHSSGHFYFTLKDERGEIKCAFFKGYNEKIKFEVKDGMQAVCFGKIGIYAQRGLYQLIVARMEPKGIGALQLAFEQLKEKLFKEGLFDEASKKVIPVLPDRIGIVTSPTGAAIRDMLHVLEKRFTNVDVLISPARVQGKGSGEEIASAIQDLNKLDSVDVIIVGRGGGSLEDLWAFNEEVVARAIFASNIPIISAVGHEVDWTISDFVADLRAPTPSVAAERVIVKKSDIIEKLDDIEKRLKDYPLEVVKEYEQRLDEIEKDLDLRFRHYIQLKEENFKLLSEKIEILSPLSILNRGYSVSFKMPGRKILKSATSLKKGDVVETRLSKGVFRSKVEDAG